MIDYVWLIKHLIVLGVAVVVFWRAGDMEDPSGYGVSILWAGLSAIVGLTTWLVLEWGLMGIIGSQVLLGVGIGVVRAAISLRATRE